MPTNLKPTDVVIVGMGAAGGVAALPLAQAGLAVIGLEAGRWLTPKDFAPDELRNNYRAWPHSVQKANREVPTHRPNASAPYSARPSFHPMMNGVGGTSLHYWAQSWRLSPWDFKVVSETTRRYGASRIPSGSTVEDWPFGVEELERYYDIVERELGVSGKAGNINGKIDRRGNIFEAPRRTEYPMPPLRWTDWHEKMASAARGLGWNPFPGPAAINTRTYEGRSGCAYHGFCARGGCHVNAKGSTAVTTIPKAQKTGHLDVVTDAHVTEINVDGNGRVTGVSYVKGTETFFQPASVVLLAMYTYENVRTLLLSTSKAFPNGLANNHRQVGRHYITHATGGSVQALFPVNLNNWYGLPAQGVAVDDFADDNFDHSKLDFIGGGNLFVFSDRRPIGAASMNTFGKVPSWGSTWKAFVKQNADRAHGAYIQKSTLPYEDNYLDLDPTVKDPLGLPVCRITADFKENERKAAAFVADRMEQWYRAAGATDVIRNPLGTMGPSTHAYGGTRMGDNAETNVVNRWGFAHEAPNLGVLGASVMGTSGAHNPTLTVQALAWRTAEYLIKNWKSLASGASAQPLFAGRPFRCVFWHVRLLSAPAALRRISCPNPLVYSPGVRVLSLSILIVTLARAAAAQSSAPYAVVFDQYMTPAAGAEDLVTAQHLLATLEDRWIPLKLGTERTRLSVARGALFRAGKFIALDVPQEHMLMVIAHEVFGHGARFRELGDGRIGYGFDAPIPYGSGDAYTSFSGQFPVSPLAHLSVSASGIEAQHSLADAITDRAVARGRIHYREAWLYFESRLTGMTYILTASENSREGHDVADFLENFEDACKAPCEPLTRRYVQDRALLALADPLLFYALYGVAGSYIGEGNPTGPMPLIPVGGGVRILPSLGYALAPYGAEWTLRTSWRTPQRADRRRLTHLVLRVGNTGASTTWGLTGRVADVWRIKGLQIDAAVNVWRQPDVFGDETSAPLGTGAGATGTVLVPLPAFLRSRWSDALHVTAGYKARGYIPGEQLSRGALLRAGITLR